MDKNNYQEELSVKSSILLDRGYKQAKVDKMLSILMDSKGIDTSKSGTVVDVGCSAGFFISALVPHFENVVGVDIDKHALEFARTHSGVGDVIYINGDSMSLPLSDNSVDLIICNHVYEHVPDPVTLFSEINRVLRNQGICYLGAASRLTIMEPHYHLPFLSWLPKTLANVYYKIMGKGDFYYENLRTYWGIKSLIKQFEVLDYTLAVVKDPDKYSARDIISKGGLYANIPIFLWRLFYWFLPSYIFILKKR